MLRFSSRGLSPTTCLTSASASAPIALAPLVTARQPQSLTDTSRAQHLTQDSRKQIRRCKGDRLLAFCRLTRAAPQSALTRASNVRPALQLPLPPATLPSHTRCTHTHPVEHETSRSRHGVFSRHFRTLLSTHLASPHTGMAWHGISCNACTPRKRNGPTAAGCR